ncbi:MAG: hypothetical protein HOV81_40575 [Kofleriaceae bacterium]|nr:hypothetical protein [Kofleriaceae bacterium]
MKLVIALFVAVIGTTMAAGQANAGTWTIPAAGCVPGDPAIQANRYLVTGGSVKHQSTATGVITLYCPITFATLLTTGTLTFVVTFADSDGFSTAANVTAQLIKLNSSNGVLTSIGSSLSSDAMAATTGGTMTTAFPHTIVANDYYYVRVDINRTTTSQGATFFGVRISG